MSNTIQLGSFLFSEVEGAPEKVFIQHATDGGGGNFLWKEVPFLVRSSYNILTILEFPMIEKDHAEIDNVMFKFWEKNF